MAHPYSVVQHDPAVHVCASPEHRATFCHARTGPARSRLRDGHIRPHERQSLHRHKVAPRWHIHIQSSSTALQCACLRRQSIGRPSVTPAQALHAPGSETGTFASRRGSPYTAIRSRLGGTSIFSRTARPCSARVCVTRAQGDLLSRPHRPCTLQAPRRAHSPSREAVPTPP